MTDTIEERLIVLPKQREMLVYDKRWGAARGGQRAGKTTAWVYWLLSRLDEFPEANAVAVGATYQQLREGLFGTIQDTLWKHGYEDGIDFKYSGSPRPWIKFANGAKLHSWSAEIVGRVRSANVQTLIVEEPQTWGPQAVRAWESLIGRLTTNERVAKLYSYLKPQGRMSFNPSGVGPGHWLYEMIVKEWPKEDWHCWQVSVRDNSLLLKDDPDYITNLMRGVSPDRWLTEIDGEWATYGGDVYRGFRPDIHGVWKAGLPPLALDPSRPLMWSLDFNIANMASVISQLYEQTDVITGYEQRQPGAPPEPITRPMVDGWQRQILTVLDEIALRDATIGQAADEFVLRYGDWLRTHRVTVRLYGDSTGGSRNQQTILTNWEVVRDALDAADIAWESFIPANGPEWDRVNAMNAQFQTGAGYGLIVDEAKCPELVADWRTVPRKANENKIDKLKYPERTHWSDALGYAVLTEQRISRREVINFLDVMGR
jgi:hypothetical protein